MAPCAFKNQKLIHCRTFYQNWLEDLEDGLPYETGYFPNKTTSEKIFYNKQNQCMETWRSLDPNFWDSQKIQTATERKSSRFSRINSWDFGENFRPGPAKLPSFLSLLPQRRDHGGFLAIITIWWCLTSVET